MRSVTSIGSTSFTTSTAAAAAASGGVTDAKAKRDTERLRQASQAVETLKRRTDEAKAERKAIAKRKLDALKEQLRQMQMWGASPRQIAQLAKELAAAVKSYASAGGTDGGGAPGGAETTGAQDAGGEPASTEAANTDGAEAAQAKAATDEAEDTSDAPETETDEAAAKSPYDKAIAAQQEDARRQARMGAEAEEDRQFLALARSLAKALKAAADREAAKTAGSEVNETKAADKATREALRAVDDAERDLSETASPLSLVFMSI